MSLHILLSGFFQNYLLRGAMQNSGESLEKFQVKYMRVFPSNVADLHALIFANTKSAMVIS